MNVYILFIKYPGFNLGGRWGGAFALHTPTLHGAPPKILNRPLCPLLQKLLDETFVIQCMCMCTQSSICMQWKCMHLYIYVYMYARALHVDMLSNIHVGGLCNTVYGRYST